MQPTQRSNLLSVIGKVLSAWFLAPLIAGAYLLATEQLDALEIGFYSGFIALGLLVIGLNFVPLKTKANIYLVIVFGFLPLYAYEAYVSIASSDKKGFASFDKRTRYQVVMDLRKANVEAYPFKSPGRKLLEVGDQEVMPLAGIPSVTTVLCSEAGPYLVYDSDEFGFNNPPGVWDQPIQVALLGDSFTHGACVAADKHFSGIIRARFPGTLNLGMSGTGPLTQFAGVREYLWTLKPRFVFWFYTEGNDLILYKFRGIGRSSEKPDFLRELERELLPRYLEPGFKQDLLGKKDAMRDAMLAFVEDRIERETKKIKRAMEKAESFSSDLEIVSKFFTLHNIRKAVNKLPLGKERALRDKLEEARKSLPLYKQMVEMAQKEIAGWGGRLSIVYLPSNLKRSYRNPLKEELLALWKDLGIEVIDPTADFQKHPNPKSLKPRHYGEEGYAIVAEAVLQHLERLRPQVE